MNKLVNFTHHLNGASMLAAGCVIAVMASISGPALAGDESAARAQQMAEKQAVADVEVNREATIQMIVSSWEPSIEGRGGSASQLESTLQHADAETLLKISQASSLEEINRILSQN